jgi:hypothetical protein
LPHRHSELLASIDRRLWRDLGLADPEPELLRFLPMLVVAWSDGKLGPAEGNLIRDRARSLPQRPREWITQRLAYPPGPYFRCQVTHLLAFMANTWGDNQREGCRDWTETGERWARELIADQGLFRRLFGGRQREAADLAVLNDAMNEHGIFVSDRIWSLARGAHAEADPARIAVCIKDADQSNQALGISFDGEGEHLAVATFTSLARDEDLDPRQVEQLLNQSPHLREAERWVRLGEECSRSGRPLTDLQRAELRKAVRARSRCEFEEVSFAELAYLEDALSVDARWMSWVAGRVEELRVDHTAVTREQVPGTFRAARAKVKAQVAQSLVPGPTGLGFRVLELQDGEGGLRLATPALTVEPPSRDACAWIARFLPAMCDPWTQLVLDFDGPRWVAEVLPEMAEHGSERPEPLMPGRALLVPPWVWFRAADALGVRFFAAKRKRAGAA